MSSFVVDASVVVKWYVPEAHGDAALRLLDRDDVLCVPDLLFAEFGNILWKKVRGGELPTAEVGAIVEALHVVPFDVHPSSALLAAALALALDNDRTVYDCIYLALAVALDCQLVTADMRLVRALEGTPLSQHAVLVEHLS